ncbi:MAG: FAD-dependent oxidoreductase [Patescibacteria group bacterium]|mgnify:CR=1 FL=1
MQTKLLGSETIAEGTMLFKFEKPKDFEYKAGQNADFFLINSPETDAEGDKRTFSLASVPTDEHLAIATRMRDTSFKRVLKNMSVGTELSIEGPYGDFFLHENVNRPAIFLAGGIGITPFYSMVTNASLRSLPHKIILLYSNRRPEDAPFLENLISLPFHDRNFKFVGTMTNMESSKEKWLGERGYINAEMLARHVDKKLTPIYYIAGPITMVTAMRDMLNRSGVSNDDIRTEEFTGY